MTLNALDATRNSLSETATVIQQRLDPFDATTSPVSGHPMHMSFNSNGKSESTTAHALYSESEGGQATHTHTHFSIPFSCHTTPYLGAGDAKVLQRRPGMLGTGFKARRCHNVRNLVKLCRPTMGTMGSRRRKGGGGLRGAHQRREMRFDTIATGGSQLAPWRRQ